jgi:hypothetical protein
VHPSEPASYPVGDERRLPPTRTLVLLAVLVAVAIAGAVVLLSGSSDDSGGGALGPAAAASEPPGPSDAEMAAFESRSEAVAQEQTRTAVIAIETFATQNGGSYLGATPAALQEIEPTLPAFIELEEITTERFTVRVPAEVGDNWFAVDRDGDGPPTYSCGVPGQGSCPSNGTWG